MKLQVRSITSGSAGWCARSQGLDGHPRALAEPRPAGIQFAERFARQPCLDETLPMSSVCNIRLWDKGAAPQRSAASAAVATAFSAVGRRQGLG
jgi:hypothetical protein